MKCRLAEQKVEEGGVICLNDEEEDLFCRYPEERWANDRIWRIGPYPSMDEVRVPWRGREDGNLQYMSSTPIHKNSDNLQR